MDIHTHLHLGIYYGVSRINKLPYQKINKVKL